jgi:hypothetical protein
VQPSTDHGIQLVRLTAIGFDSENKGHV